MNFTRNNERSISHSSVLPIIKYERALAMDDEVNFDVQREKGVGFQRRVREKTKWMKDDRRSSKLELNVIEVEGAFKLGAC